MRVEVAGEFKEINPHEDNFEEIALKLINREMASQGLPTDEMSDEEPLNYNELHKELEQLSIKLNKQSNFSDEEGSEELIEEIENIKQLLIDNQENEMRDLKILEQNGGVNDEEEAVEDTLASAKDFLKKYHNERRKIIIKISNSQTGSYKHQRAQDLLKDFEQDNEEEKDNAEITLKINMKGSHHSMLDEYDRREHIIKKRKIRRHMQRLLKESNGSFKDNHQFPRLFAFYLSTFKPQDRIQMLEAMNVDPKRSMTLVEDQHTRVKMAQISRAMITDGDVVGKNVHEDMVFRLAINDKDPFGRDQDEQERAVQIDKLNALCDTLQTVPSYKQIALLDDIVTRKNINRLNGDNGEKVINALRTLPNETRSLIENKIKLFVDQDMRENLLEMALLKNLNFDSLDAASQAEIRLVTYLKRAQDEQRLDEGDVRMEISRRRLQMDPSLFRGVRADPVQENRVRMNKNLEVEHYKRDLTALEREYIELFPNDGFGGLSLARDLKYLTLVELYNKEKAQKGAPFFNMEVAIWDMADMYFEMYGKSDHALATEGQLEDFRDQMVRREAKIFIDQDIQIKNSQHNNRSIICIFNSHFLHFLVHNYTA